MKKHTLSSFYGILLLLLISAARLQAQSPNQASATGHVFAEVIAAFSAVETSQTKGDIHFSKLIKRCLGAIFRGALKNRFDQFFGVSIISRTPFYT